MVDLTQSRDVSRLLLSELALRGVCGAELEHISSRSRILRLLEDMDPSWRSRIADDMVERLLVTWPFPLNAFSSSKEICMNYFEYMFLI